MEKFKNFISNFKLPGKSQTKLVLSSFSRKEWVIFGVLFLVCVLSGLLILESVNKSFMTDVPMRGGQISEGILGSPRFINPVLDFSDTDRDLVSLVYSGLMRKSPDGILIPDLAEKYDVSKNGLIYTLPSKIIYIFHDGTPLSVDDIIFTIEKIKDR